MPDTKCSINTKSNLQNTLRKVNTLIISSSEIEKLTLREVKHSPGLVSGHGAEVQTMADFRTCLQRCYLR